MRERRSASPETRTTIRGALIRLFSPGPNGEHPWDGDRGRILLDDIPIAEAWMETFSNRPDFGGRRVVEIGCGFGALCVVAARRGARSVLGVELDRSRADLARSLVAEHIPDLAGRIDFADYESVRGRAMGTFDIALSQNAFEHYRNPERVLEETLALLRRGGRLYAGFGPLWESPFGSHLVSVSRLPWAHLWAGGSLLEEHNRLRPHDPMNSWESLGLNRAPAARFRRMFREAEGAELLELAENRALRRRSRAIHFLVECGRRVPGLARYLTMSLNVVLQKPDGPETTPGRARQLPT